MAPPSKKPARIHPVDGSQAVTPPCTPPSRQCWTAGHGQQRKGADSRMRVVQIQVSPAGPEASDGSDGQPDLKSPATQKRNLQAHHQPGQPQQRRRRRDDLHGSAFTWHRAHRYLNGTMLAAGKAVDNHTGIVGQFVDSCLRGLGQVVFVNNPLTGLFILAAALVNSWHLAAAGCTGLMASTATAMLLGLPRSAIRGGLYGYNGYLVGTALALFQSQWHGSDWNPLMLGPIVFMSALSTIITTSLAHVGRHIAGHSIAVFTLPFHIATWIFLLGAQNYSYFPTGLSNPRFASPTDTDDRQVIAWNYLKLFKAVWIGVAQVFFFNTVPSGVLVVVGMVPASRISALAALLGSLLGLLTALSVGAPEAEIEAGLWNFDAVLAAICVGGMFFEPSRGVAVLAAMAAMTAALIHGAVQSALQPVAIPPLTFPAAATCAMFTLLGGSVPSARIVPLTEITVPEEHLHREQEETAPSAWEYVDELEAAGPGRPATAISTARRLLGDTQ